MAFQANILGQQANLASGCSILCTDNSNYDTNGLSRFARARFSNLYVFVTRPDATVYTFGSGTLIAVDASITDPSALSAPQQITYNFINTDVNGVWQVDMVTVPDYAPGETYQIGEVVVFGGGVWQNTLANNLLAPSVPNGWVVTTIPALRAALSSFDSGMNVTIDCIQNIYYQTLMVDTVNDTYAVEVNDTCTAIEFTDTSNWVTNNEEGHALADFSNYRKITLTRPSTGTYVYFTVAGVGVDEVISPASVGSQDFIYTLLDTDIDGRYQIAICEYPTWGIGYNYSAARLTVVFYNDILYKCIVDNIGLQPDLNPTEWEVYAPDPATELVSRYCYVANISVFCIGLNQCIEEKLHEAICLIQSDFCNDDILCKNRKYLAINELLLLRKGVEHSTNRRMWTEVDKDFNLMRQICNC
jgi:hypothetical protein